MSHPTSTTPNKDWALYYASLGQPVFPVYEIDSDERCSCHRADCTKPGKHPRTDHGYLEASTDPAQIAAWWHDTPQANIGAPTGSNGLWDVLDIDGEVGRTTMDGLLHFYEDQLPDGPRVRTGSGAGTHYLGRPAGAKGSASKIGGPGSKIDWRGEGTYVVLPPSNHASGGTYTWEVWPDEAPLPEFSPWLVRAAKEAGGTKQRPSTRGKKDSRRKKRGAQPVVHDGEGREAALLSKLGEWRRNGDDKEVIRAAAYAWADKYTSPPLRHEVIDKKVEWLWGARDAADEKFRAQDFGNARFFLDQHPGLLKYDHKRARWYVWDPDARRWQTDVDGILTRMWEAAAKARELNALTYQGVDDEMFAAESKAARRMGFQSAMTAGLRIAQDLEPAADDGSGWDANPYLLACLGDVVDLRTGVARPARPEDKLTKNTEVPYDPQATASRWQRFLPEIHVLADGITPDAEMIAFIQRCAGYSASGLTSEEKFLLLHGGGRNGKTKELEAIAGGLGDSDGGYACWVDFATVQEASFRRSGSAPNGDVARLAGRRYVVGSEPYQSAPIEAATLKNIVGGDKVVASEKFKPEFQFKPSFTLWLATNNRPQINDPSDGMWERVLLVEYRRQFLGSDAQLDLAEVLRAEAPGILAWIVQGAVAYFRDGLQIPKSVKVATAIFRADSDPMAAFFDEFCVLGPGETVGAQVLWTVYDKYYCGDHNLQSGSKARASRVPFGRQMGDRFEKVRTKEGYEYHGIALNEATKKRLAERSDWEAVARDF